MERAIPSNDVNTNPEQLFTQPPARYSEATLIKIFGRKWVVRLPMPTIETIQKRVHYLVSKRFEPTETGEIVNSLIVNSLGIVNVITVEMEAKLDDVRSWKRAVAEVIDSFILALKGSF